MVLAGNKAKQVQWTNVYQDALVSTIALRYPKTDLISFQAESVHCYIIVLDEFNPEEPKCSLSHHEQIDFPLPLFSGILLISATLRYKQASLDLC